MKFHEMTFPELRRVKRDACVVLAPIAACEQHSHHLATFTDTVLVTGVADGVEARLSGAVLQLPTMWMGASHHHLRFGATLSAGVDTHVDLLCDLVVPLLEDGYERLLILNGHGGNIDTMQVALRRLQPSYRGKILAAASYWDLAARELAALGEGPRKVMGHACEYNDVPREDPALRGLYLAEDMFQRTDHGAVGYPELAGTEKGRAFLAAAVERTAEAVQALLARPLPR
jgi:creatinine amidohydrolase